MRNSPNRGLVLLALCAVTALLGALAAEEEDLRFSLPSQTELSKLTELVASFVDVSIKYDPQKLRGTVNLSMNGELSRADIWAVYNQVLTGQDFATVVIGQPPVYQVVPLADAAGLSAAVQSSTLDELPYPPSYLLVVHELEHLTPSDAVQVLTSLFFAKNIGQVRTLGKNDSRILLAGVAPLVQKSIALLDMPQPRAGASRAAGATERAGVR